MSGRKDIEEKLQEFVASDLLHGEAADLTPATNLLALGILDSLTIELMSAFIERTFGVALPDAAQAEDLASISAVAVVVEQLQRAAAANPKK